MLLIKPSFSFYCTFILVLMLNLLRKILSKILHSLFVWTLLDLFGNFRF